MATDRHTAVSLKAAAAELGKSEVTLRRWVQAGAPCVRPGEPGRGKGALVEVGDLLRWKACGGSIAPANEEWLQKVAEGLGAFFRERRHRHPRAEVPDHIAALLYHDLFVFIAQRAGVDSYPKEIELLRAIALQNRSRAERF